MNGHEAVDVGSLVVQDHRELATLEGEVLLVVQDHRELATLEGGVLLVVQDHRELASLEDEVLHDVLDQMGAVVKARKEDEVVTGRLVVAAGHYP